MLKKFVALGLISFFSWSTAQAGLINQTGEIDGLDLRWGKTESNQIQTFNEQQNTFVSNSIIQVDFLLGTNLFVGDNLHGKAHSNSGLYLAEGSYNSHLLHFDPLGTSRGHIYNSLITFEEDIVAIILGGKYLSASDSTFGGTDTLYQNSNSRRLEAHDFLTFNSSNSIILDHLAVGKYWIDNARIITQANTHAVPEPGSMALFGIGLLGLIGARTLSRKNER